MKTVTSIAERLHLFAPQVEPRVCPDCDGDDFIEVFDLDQTNFLCTDCGSCWHLDDDVMLRMVPQACIGCDYRIDCISRNAHN